MFVLVRFAPALIKIFTTSRCPLKLAFIRGVILLHKKFSGTDAAFQFVKTKLQFVACVSFAAG
jgi:hypothetical protein